MKRRSKPDEERFHDASHQDLSGAQYNDWRSFYEDRYADKRKNTVRRLSAFHRADNLALATRIRHRISQCPGIVIDVGAGASIASLHLRASYVIKVDLASKALIDDRSSDSATTVFRVCCDAVTLPFDDGVCDAVVATQILEHIPDYRGALHEFARVVRPGGFLVLTVPNAYTHMYRQYHRVSRKIDEAGHLRAFDPELLRCEVENHFDVMAVRTTGYGIFAGLMRFERMNSLQGLTGVLDRLTGRSVFADVGAAVLRIENHVHRNDTRGMSHEIYGIKK